MAENERLWVSKDKDDRFRVRDTAGRKRVILFIWWTPGCSKHSELKGVGCGVCYQRLSVGML